MRSEALSILAGVCLMTSASFTKEWRMLLHPGCTILIDVFVVTRNDVTTHAPKVFIFFYFFFILLKVPPSGHFATKRSRKIKEFEGSPVRTWKRQIPFLARPLGVRIFERDFRRLTGCPRLRSPRGASHQTILLPHARRDP